MSNYSQEDLINELNKRKENKIINKWNAKPDVKKIQEVELNINIINELNKLPKEELKEISDKAEEKWLNIIDAKRYEDKKKIEIKLKEDIEKDVLMFVATKQENDATELIVQEIKRDQHIYTTRDDIKSEIWFYDDGIYKPNGKTIIQEYSRKILKQLYTPQRVNKIIAKIEADTFIDVDKFFETKNIDELPFKNGILNLKTKELTKFTPEKIFFNKLPVIYNPEAKCKNIDKFLEEILKNPDDKKVMYEKIGYSLWQDHFIEKATMFVGDGRNGKCQKGEDKILMQSGEWKKIKDIKINEKIISPQKDGSSKFVKIINIHNRFEENVFNVYEEARKKRLLYTCAGNHIIPVIKKWSKRTSKDDSTPRLYGRKLYENSAEYISKLFTKKSGICSFSTTAVKYNKKSEKINPYCLGAWLGDGHFSIRKIRKKGLNKRNWKLNNGEYVLGKLLGITTKDKEVVNEFYKNYSEDMQGKYQKENNLASTYVMSVIGKLAKELKYLKLDGKGSETKFIPKSCLVSSIKYRFELLAGLIDTDGFIDKNGAIYYYTKSKQLSEDIKNLVFSLGGYCETRLITKKCQNDFIGNYFENSIQFKNKKIIPIRIPFKKNRLKIIKYEPRHIAIKCIKTKSQQVYGIEIEGDSKWYITNNWMVTHNSKLHSLIKSFVGAENCCSVSLSQMNSQSSGICELHKSLVNIAGDLSNTALKDTGLLKEILGRDMIGAKRKYLRDLFFVNHCKQFFACNELPRVYDMSFGFWCRWDLFEFPYTFISKEDYKKEKDKSNYKIRDTDIIEKITTEEELSGLLNKALDGLHNLFKNKEFSNTKGVEDIKNFWVRKSDSFMSFCMDYIERTVEDNEFITKKDLRQKFSQYCNIHKIKGSSDKGIQYILQNNYGAISERISNIESNYNQEVIWSGIKWNNKINKLVTCMGCKGVPNSIEIAKSLVSPDKSTMHTSHKKDTKINILKIAKTMKEKEKNEK